MASRDKGTYGRRRSLGKTGKPDEQRMCPGWEGAMHREGKPACLAECPTQRKGSISEMP